MLLTAASLSCSKSSDPAPRLTAKDYLPMATKGWVQSAGRIAPAYLGKTSTFPSGLSYNDDDIIIFSSTGTWRNEEGPTKAKASDPQLIAGGTWSIQLEKTLVLKIDGTVNPLVATIENASSAELQLQYTEVINGTTYTRTDTYVPVK